MWPELAPLPAPRCIISNVLSMIRPTHVEGDGPMKSGTFLKFIFQKQDDGQWICVEDQK
jgi:hypothetical protein